MLETRIQDGICPAAPVRSRCPLSFSFPRAEHVTVAADPKSIFEKVWRSDRERGIGEARERARKDQKTSGIFRTSVRGRHRAGRKAPAVKSLIIALSPPRSPVTFFLLFLHPSLSLASSIIPRGIQRIDMSEMSFGASSVRNRSAS